VIRIDHLDPSDACYGHVGLLVELLVNVPHQSPQWYLGRISEIKETSVAVHMFGWTTPTTVYVPSEQFGPGGSCQPASILDRLAMEE